MSIQLSNFYVDSGSQNNINNTGELHKKECKFMWKSTVNECAEEQSSNPY